MISNIFSCGLEFGDPHHEITRGAEVEGVYM